MGCEEILSDKDYILKFLNQQIRDHVPRGKRDVEIRYNSYVHSIYLYIRDYIINNTCEDDDIIDALGRKRRDFYDCYGEVGNEKNWFLGIYEDTVCYIIDILLARKYGW